MLVDNAHNTAVQKYNVVINGVIKKKNVTKAVAENFILMLSEDLHSAASIVPVTEDGLEILFG